MAVIEDVAPALLEQLQREFADRAKANRKLQDLLKLVEEGKATYIQAEELACEMGEALSQAFGNCLSSAVLPDGKMYYNIAQRVVAPMLREDHQLIAKATEQVQAALNKKAGIGLKPQTVAVDEDRIYGIVNKISEAEVFDDVAWVLGEPVVNFSQAVVDSTLKANVDFQGKAGLTPKIYRKAESKCCKWCRDLAGVYDYPMVPDDVYRRHERCRCIVDYDPGDGRRQNVHTKQWKNAVDRDMIKARKVLSEKQNETRAIRGMANGPRRGRLTIVSKEEEKAIRKIAADIGIPDELLRFNEGWRTSFDDDTGLIYVRGDVFPSQYAPNPDSILSEKCALAHEYYGHYLHHPSKFNVNDWRDEFQASYRAALDTPNLTDNERAMLMIDAFDRARSAGVSVTLNKIARRMIHGIE